MHQPMPPTSMRVVEWELAAEWGRAMCAQFATAVAVVVAAAIAIAIDYVQHKIVSQL